MGRFGDLAARDELVRRFLPLAHKLARRYSRSSEPYEDLVQVASLGLLKAVERYDPRREASFTSYAIPTITGELKRYFRDAGWSVHVPRGAQERALAIEHASARLTDPRGRPPTVQQLAEDLHLSCEQVLDGLLAARAYEALSLDAPRPGSDDDDLATVGATIGAEDGRYELIDADASVAEVVHMLSRREREILRLRFIGERTQSQIAAELGVSQMQVSRLLRRSLEKLRALVEESRPLSA
ncbi:MAG: SigB/SigF/SigG family RNA polymerase sigma factor [Solirubrobacteraceae bacterium]